MQQTQLQERILHNTRQAARALLGCILVRRDGKTVRRARIVETEAYLENDPASHSFGGCTQRNRTMFGPPGCAYVYRIHQVVCLNVVTGPENQGEAVLIRAVEPIEGQELMERARRRRTVGSTRPAGYALSNGPGKLCQALDITMAHDGCFLLGPPGARSELQLEPRPDRSRLAIVRDTRIGISRAQDAPLRFFISGNPWVSARRQTAPPESAGSGS